MESWALTQAWHYSQNQEILCGSKTMCPCNEMCWFTKQLICKKQCVSKFWNQDTWAQASVMMRSSETVMMSPKMWWHHMGVVVSSGTVMISLETNDVTETVMTAPGMCWHHLGVWWCHLGCDDITWMWWGHLGLWWHHWRLMIPSGTAMTSPVCVWHDLRLLIPPRIWWHHLGCDDVTWHWFLLGPVTSTQSLLGVDMVDPRLT